MEISERLCGICNFKGFRQRVFRVDVLFLASVFYSLAKLPFVFHSLAYAFPGNCPPLLKPAVYDANFNRTVFFGSLHQARAGQRHLVAQLGNGGCCP